VQTLLQTDLSRHRLQYLFPDLVHNTAKIAHRDIKPENILLNDLDEVKISDFGLGTHKLKGKKHSGTPLYMPPESLSSDGESSSLSGDIWGLGVTLLVLLTGKHPEFADQKINVEKEIGQLREVSSECKEFIRGCLQVDAGKRLKAEELLGHEWLGGEQLRASSNPYAIEITPADELNIFKNVEKKPEVSVFQLTIER
jgi:serine/threonine protein kinase